MRWTPKGRSADLEDRRGARGGGGGAAKLGIGGVLILGLLSAIFGTDFFALVGGGGEAPPGQESAPVPTTQEEELQFQFVSTVLDDSQQTWERIFAESGQEYRRAKLVIFTDSVRSGCGYAEAAMGPFYCPADEKVYIDLGFYNQLQERFGAPGDFAQA